MKRGEMIFSIVLVPVDFLMLVLAGFTTYLLRTRILDAFRPVQFDLNLPLTSYMISVVFFSLVFVIIYALSGLYVLSTTRSTIEEFFKVAIASAAGLMTVIVYIFLRSELFDSRFLVLGAGILSIIFVSLGRLVVRKIQRYMVVKREYGVHKVLVIGNDDVSKSIIKTMREHAEFGYKVVKQLSDARLDEIKIAVGNPGVDEVILANPNYPQQRVQEIVDFCHENHLIFRFVPNIHQTLTSNFSMETITGIPLVELKRTKLEGWWRVFKRVFDYISSLVGLAILLPVFAVIAFAIKWETAGPVFVHLDRVSRNRKIKLHKFRSMIEHAEKYKQQLIDMGYNDRSDGPLFKMENDPRTTKVGRFLRRTRLDELPQLWNVVQGEISLVGPRPHQPDEISRYQKHQKKVLAIKAGVTGMAQISGSSDLPFEEEVAIDTLYIENWSFRTDLKIIVLTILKLFRDKSAV